MEVWIELALIENFLLDGVLLFLALKVARVRVSKWRLPLAASLGAAEAVLFPMISLPTAAAYAVKFAGGAILVAVAVGEKRIKPYLAAGGAFFFLTFALGGLLLALYAFTGTDYNVQGGYLVERAPIGLILGGTGAFAISVFLLAKRWYRYRTQKRDTLSCTLSAGGREVHLKGLADSGNLLSFRGEPVCVASAAGIFALFGREAKAAGRIAMNTVSGEKTAPVFALDRLTISLGGRTVEQKGVYLTVGDVRGDYQLILNTRLMEV